MMVIALTHCVNLRLVDVFWPGKISSRSDWRTFNDPNPYPGDNINVEDDQPITLVVSSLMVISFSRIEKVGVLRLHIQMRITRISLRSVCVRPT
jgi:hypothetical protein